MLFAQHYAAPVGTGSDAHVAAGSARAAQARLSDRRRHHPADQPDPAHVEVEVPDLLRLRRRLVAVRARHLAGAGAAGRVAAGAWRRSGFFLVARDAVRRAGRRSRWRRWSLAGARPHGAAHRSSTRTSTRPGASSPCRSRWCWAGGWCSRAWAGVLARATLRAAGPVRADPRVRVSAGGADTRRADRGVHVDRAPAADRRRRATCSGWAISIAAAGACCGSCRCRARCSPSRWSASHRRLESAITVLDARPVAPGLGRRPRSLRPLQLLPLAAELGDRHRADGRASSCWRRWRLMLGRRGAGLGARGPARASGSCSAIYFRHRAFGYYFQFKLLAFIGPLAAADRGGRGRCGSRRAGPAAIAVLAACRSVASFVAEIDDTGYQLPQATIQLSAWADSLARERLDPARHVAPDSSSGPRTSSPRARCARSCRCSTPTTPMCRSRARPTTSSPRSPYGRPPTRSGRRCAPTRATACTARTRPCRGRRSARTAPLRPDLHRCGAQPACGSNVAEII